MQVRYKEKIQNFEGLLACMEEARKAKKNIVHCHGCFDIVHPGHIRHLAWAKEQGDYLVVTLTADRFVGKGENHPYFNEKLRAEQVAAIEFVDCVFVNPSTDACLAIELIRPNIYVKGPEYQNNMTPNLMLEKYYVETWGGELMFSPKDIIFSSTELGILLSTTVSGMGC
jgi:rfaE bifunctional protein nucleotidyltransferase chain/domain